MGNNESAAAKVRRLLSEQDRSYAWLARTADVPYKRVLSEVKHESRPMSLDTAVVTSRALGVTLPVLVGEVAA